MPPTPMLLLRILLALLAGALPLAVAAAQDMPPFPVLYGGVATVDGAPAPEGARLYARAGDYETWTTIEAGGAYRNLLVGPPSAAYLLRPVTFHLEGMQAEEQDVFLPSSAPAFKDQGFDLHFTWESASAAATPAPAEAAGTSRRAVLLWGAMAATAVAIAAVLFVWLRKRRA